MTEYFRCISRRLPTVSRRSTMYQVGSEVRVLKYYRNRVEIGLK
jgi:hypothetical protein